jgi:hypothetical protein
MAKRCGPNKSCGMKDGLFNPFFTGNYANPYGYSGSSVTYSTEYQAILDRWTVLGITLPDATRKAKDDAHIVSLKALGIWALLDIYFVLASHDSDAATVNWKTPASFQCTKVAAPAFVANQGFTGNGSTSYLNTNWIPGTNGVNFTQNAGSFGCFVNTTVAEAGVDIGSQNTSGNNASYVITRSATNTTVTRVNDGASLSVANTAGGMFLSQRTASNARRTFKNGVSATSDTQVSQSRNLFNFYIGCLNNAGATANFSTKQISMGFAGATLAGLEDDFYTEWNAYFTSL